MAAEDKMGQHTESAAAEDSPEAVNIGAAAEKQTECWGQAAEHTWAAGETADIENCMMELQAGRSGHSAQKEWHSAQKK